MFSGHYAPQKTVFRDFKIFENVLLNLSFTFLFVPKESFFCFSKNPINFFVAFSNLHENCCYFLFFVKHFLLCSKFFYIIILEIPYN